jgi:hypothetical protein
VRYLWGAEGGSVLVFEAHGQAPGESEENRSSKEAFEGSAQLQAGAGNEIDPATAFEEVTRPIQALHQFGLFFYLGVLVLVLRIWSNLRVPVLVWSFPTALNGLERE